MNRPIKRLLFIPLFFGAALIFASWLSTAALAGSPKERDDREIIPDEVERSQKVGNVWIGEDSGNPLVLTGVGYPLQPGSPETMASDFLQENADLLGLNFPDLADLEHEFTHQGPAGSTVRFHQFYQGIPVYRGEIAVHINPNLEATYVTNSYKNAIQLSTLTPVFSPEEARGIAFDHLKLELPIRFLNINLVAYFNKGVSRLAYQILVQDDSPSVDWEVLVDALTGEIFKAQNITYLQDKDDPDPARDTVTPLVLVNGSGNIFNPDPLSSSGANYGDPGFSDSSDADSAQLTGELLNITLQDIDFSGGQFTLRGPYADIRDVEAPFNGLFSQASSSFNYSRNADAFEAVNAYYHLDTSMRYINQVLGIPVSPTQYNGGVRYDPSGFNGADNSRYSSLTGDLSFGEGGVDDAEDSDVIHHELGHGLHDWLTNGSLSQVDGLSEGFGDYWAQSYNRSLGLWTPSDPQYHWVFNWDGHNEFWAGRSTNYGALYPGGLVGQIHTDGQIWSTCNMRIWDSVGRTASDTAHLEGLAMTGSNTNQEQAANAVLQAAIDMAYPFADIQSMHNIYSSCGYAMASLPVPDFTISANPDETNVCTPADAQTIITIGSISGYSDPVTLSANGSPAGTTATFSQNPVIAPGASQLTIGNTGAAAPGIYAVDVVGIAPTSTHTTTVQVGLFDASPAAAGLLAPGDNANGIALSPELSWTPVASASQYALEVASDPGFTSLVYSVVVSGTQHMPSLSLDPLRRYYWRVQTQNPCGSGPYSPVFSFVTVGAYCASPGVGIPDGPNGILTSTVVISDTAALQDLNIYLDIDHSYVYDLSISLEHVNAGTVRRLVHRPRYGVFACSANDMDLFLDDEASLEIENGCLSSDSADQAFITGESYIPGDPPDNTMLAGYDGQSIIGEWTLTITDNASLDTGTLNSWCLLPSIQVLTGLELSPTVQTQYGSPGETLTHTLTLTNTGNIADTYGIGVSGNSWPTSGPATRGPLAPGQSATVDIQVTIPVTATSTASDNFLLTVVSGNDPGVSETAIGATSLDQVLSYLPVVYKND